MRLQKCIRTTMYIYNNDESLNLYIYPNKYILNSVKSAKVHSFRWDSSGGWMTQPAEP